MTLDSKKLAKIILVLQILFLLSIYLDKIGLTIPLLRQVTGFIYLTFVVGFLILAVVIRLTDIEPLEMLVYSAGLSFFSIMLLGLIINMFYPYLGITSPISEKPLLFTIIPITLFLNILLFKSNIKLEIPKYDINIVLIFSLFPFLSIFGSYLLCYYNDNLILLILYGLISIIPLIIVWLDICESECWFIIWTLSISLLFSVALAKKYVIGGDAHIEYYFANLVKLNGIWNLQIQNSENSLLRIVMLHPIYSILLNMSLADVFRIIHPLQYSLTPIILYVAFKKQFNKKIAFCSVSFFMFMHTFFTKLSLNTRMGIAELFLALFILCLLNQEVDRIKILATIFLLSIPLSHYGSSYFFLFALILVFILEKTGIYRCDRESKKFVTLNLILTYFVMLYGWYIYTAGSENFNLFANFIKRFLTELSKFISPETSYTVYAVSRRWVFSVEVSKDMLIVSLIFALIGLIQVIRNRDKYKYGHMYREYTLFSLSVFGLLLSTFLPTKGFATGRAYHFCLCFLSPFVVIGFIEVLKLFLKVFTSFNNINTPLKIFSVYLCIFLLFNSGFVSNVITRNSDYSPNVLIDKPRENTINDPQYISALYRSYETDQEYFAAKWLAQRMSTVGKVNLHLDVAAENAVYGLIGPKCVYIHVDNKTKVRMGYIFLRTYNLEKNIAIYKMLPWKAKNLTDVYPIMISNKIYANGGSEIYLKLIS